MSRFRYIKYARMQTLENHEHERLEVSVELREGEDASEVFDEARRFVHEKLGVRSKPLTAKLGEIATGRRS